MMNKSICSTCSIPGYAAALAVMALSLPATSRAQDAKTQPASKMYLNYDVPESPAFTVLGASPANVTRASGAKPLAVSVLGDVVSGNKLGSGLALDVAPFAYFQRFSSVGEYQADKVRRALSKIMLSFASVTPADTTAIRFGGGVRIQLVDDHDLLANTGLADTVAAALVPKDIAASGPNIPHAGVIDGTPVDLSKVYEAARNAVAARRGFAAALGGATAATLRHGIPRPDSVIQGIGAAWLAGTAYLGKGHELLGTVQWSHDTTNTDHARAGVAYRYAASSTDLSLEMAVDGTSWNRLSVLPGINTELRLGGAVGLVGALVMAPGDAMTRAHLSFRTSLRWSATEGR